MVRIYVLCFVLFWGFIREEVGMEGSMYRGKGGGGV